MLLKDQILQNVVHALVPYWIIISVKKDRIEYLGRDNGSGGYPY